jgi:heme O synthase-like polyprenyltransferase
MVPCYNESSLSENFWGLAIAETQDYLKEDVPMLPAVEGVNRVSFDTALSNILLFPFTVALFLLSVNWNALLVVVLVGAAIVLLNASFLAANLRLARSPGAMNAWNLFKFSAQYRFIMLVLIVLGHVL